MALINAASAIIAKARSKYGKRLMPRDFQAMVKCGSVGEVVQYLKSYTHFQTDLDKVSTDIHRGNLENILREKQFESFLSLCKYQTGNSPMTDFLLRRGEVRELMKFLTLLSIKRPREYIFSLPLYFNQHTDVDLERLSAIDDYDDLLEALSGTPYQRILREFPPDETGNYDLAEIEDALENAIIGMLYENIGKVKSKKTRAQLTELIDTLMDCNNYSRIIRLKKYYNLSNEAIRSHVLHYGNLSGKRLEKILRRDTFEDIYAELRQTSVGKQAQKLDKQGEMAIQGRYERCRHELYFSTNPEIVLLAYYILSETELSNVIAVVEGVRYSMEPERILQTLIL